MHISGQRLGLQMAALFQQLLGQGVQAGFDAGINLAIAGFNAAAAG